MRKQSDTGPQEEEFRLWEDDWISGLRRRKEVLLWFKNHDLR
jgi:hypothetical protein